MRGSGFLAAVALCILTTPSPAAVLEILPSGHPVAEVRIDGQGPFSFVIDTAASGTAVVPRFLEKMPLPTAGQASLGGAAGSAQIATVRLPRLEADGRINTELTAAALPPSSVDKLGVDGILGADVFARHVLEIDVPGRQWLIADTLSDVQLSGMLTPVPFDLTDGRAPVLKVLLDGKEVTAILDSGAKGTIINWAAARSLGVTPDDEDLERADAVKGATQHATASVAKTFDRIAVGEAEFRSRRLRIADLPVFETVGLAGRPAMILGIDLLADRRFVVDYQQRRVHISPPAGAGGRAVMAAGLR